MSPTLFVESHYLVNRCVYRLHEPRRGDIVIFTSPIDHKTGFIKRVIGVPGDDIEIRNKKVILNGKPLEEPYTVYTRANERLQGDNLGPLHVPERCLFVLGDNRDESFDSSVWKDASSGQPIYFLSYENVKGRLIKVP